MTDHELLRHLMEIKGHLGSLDARVSSHIESDREAFDAHLTAIKALGEKLEDKASQKQVNTYGGRIRSLEFKWYGVVGGLILVMGLFARGVIPVG